MIELLFVNLGAIMVQFNKILGNNNNKTHKTTYRGSSCCKRCNYNCWYSLNQRYVEGKKRTEDLRPSRYDAVRAKTIEKMTKISTWPFFLFAELLTNHSNRFFFPLTFSAFAFCISLPNCVMLFSSFFTRVGLLKKLSKERAQYEVFKGFVNCSTTSSPKPWLSSELYFFV